MSTQETAKITVEFILSNQEGEGELPSNEQLAAKWKDELRWYDQTVDVLSVRIIERTGELDDETAMMNINPNPPGVTQRPFTTEEMRILDN